MWGNELLAGDLCSPSAFLTFNLFFGFFLGLVLFRLRVQPTQQLQIKADFHSTVKMKLVIISLNKH